MGKQLLVCVQQRHAPNPTSCANSGSLALAETLARMLAERQAPVALVRTGCMGMCLKGPNVKLVPQGLVWNGVQASQATEILEAACDA